MAEQHFVDLESIEVPIDDLEAALDEMTDDHDDVVRNTVAVGDVMLTNDGFPDNDIVISPVDNVEGVTSSGFDLRDGTSYAYFHVDKLYERIEDARTQPFVRYVRNVDYLLGGNDICPISDETVEIVVPSDMAPAEMRGLSDDENITLGRVTTDDKLHIIVHDARDE